MYSQTKRNALIAMALLMAFLLACSAFGDETEKANKLVAEGNTAINEGNKLATDADAKSGQAAIDTMSKAGEKYREAGKKFDEASKFKINDKFKDYLSLKSQEFNKRAEMMEVAKKNTQAMLDDPESAATKLAETKSQIDKLEKEAKDLEAKADKIRTDNKDLIK